MVLLYVCYRLRSQASAGWTGSHGRPGEKRGDSPAAGAEGLQPAVAAFHRPSAIRQLSQTGGALALKDTAAYSAWYASSRTAYPTEPGA